MRKETRWLLSEIEGWTADEIISQAQADRLRQRYAVPIDGLPWGLLVFGNVPGVARPQQFVTGLTVELKNYGPEDVSIVDLPGGGSLRLVPDERWQEARYRWVGETRTAAPPGPADVFLLKPGQSHAIKVDLTDPAWFVVSTTDGKNPVAVRDIPDPWSSSFRIEYAPPPEGSVVNLPHAGLIRHGHLRSRAFNPAGGVD